MTATAVLSMTRSLSATSVPTVGQVLVGTQPITGTSPLTASRSLGVTPTAPLTPALTIARWHEAETLPKRSVFVFDTHPELSRYLYVDQRTQHLYVFERGQLLRDIPCSTGLPDDDKYTPAWEGKVGHYAGTFFSFGVWADNAWHMFMSQGAILVHSLPYTVANKVKVYQDRDALGVRPSSHGCVRISPEDADWLTKWDPEGVLMTVTDPYLEWWRKK